MSPPDDNAILLDIAKAARSALNFKADADRTSFLNDPKTQSAVLHQLLIMGEAPKRLSDSFRQQYPTIPWKAMAGMRDNLIHEYDMADIEEVWNTLEIDIPHLLDSLEPLLPKER